MLEEIFMFNARVFKQMLTAAFGDENTPPILPLLNVSAVLLVINRNFQQLEG